MGIRKPALSVDEAKRLAAARPGIIHPDLQHFSRDAAAPRLPQRAGHEERRTTSALAKRSGPESQSIRTVDALNSSTAPEKVQVFLSARPPAPGVSEIYDSLILQYSASKSLQMILRRALDDFETMLMDGSFRKASQSYPIPQETSEKRVIVQTSRMLPVSALKIARDHFDPSGLETSRAFGLKLATAALASFFDAAKAPGRGRRT
ncbi:UNVERIFIED_ORG: hypothetical protein GGI57_006399 [Rhizobium aethiopicum]|uniref:conjugal transfer protein VirC2 n=1 Tax=Rhizobium sp. N122 TaxID=1764272 RepID=UPI000B5A62C6|nr:conjugal transfer protein VirC2 [Rhizobium sp. N122]OWV73715.1 virulence protein [Rhizobium sp. N122]